MGAAQHCPSKSKIKCLTPGPDSNAEKLKSLEIALSPAKRILVRPVACRRMLANLRGHTAASMTSESV